MSDISTSAAVASNCEYKGVGASLYYIIVTVISILWRLDLSFEVLAYVLVVLFLSFENNPSHISVNSFISFWDERGGWE